MGVISQLPLSTYPKLLDHIRELTWLCLITQVRNTDLLVHTPNPANHYHT